MSRKLNKKTTICRAELLRISRFACSVNWMALKYGCAHGNITCKKPGSTPYERRPNVSTILWEFMGECGVFLQITACGVAGKYDFKAREELRRIKALVNSVFLKIENLNIIKTVLGTRLWERLCYNIVWWGVIKSLAFIRNIHKLYKWV